MRGAADAEKGPPFRDGTVIEHMRVTRDVSVVRLQLDQPLYYYPGQYVTVQVPQWPRRWRYLSPAIPADRGGAIEFHVRSVTGGMVSTAIVGETKPGDRWRLSNPHGGMQVDRDGGDVLMVAGSTGLAPLRTLIMDLTRYGENPRVHLFFGARYPVRALRPAHAVADRVDEPVAVGDAGLGVQHRSAVGRRLPRCRAAPRPACAPDGRAARRGDPLRRLGRSADPDLRRPEDGRGHQGGADRKRRTRRTHTARSPRELAVAGSSTMPEFETVTLHDPSSSLTATYVPNAGMIGTSLSDDGVELLGQRRGLQAYVSTHRTMGIPILYPWANRLSSNGYGVEGAVVTLTPGTGGVRTDQHGVPIHGTLAGYPDWHVTTQLESQLTAELDYAARPGLLASLPVPAPGGAGRHARGPHAHREDHGDGDDGCARPAVLRLSPVPTAARMRRGRNGRSRHRPCGSVQSTRGASRPVPWKPTRRPQKRWATSS